MDNSKLTLIKAQAESWKMPLDEYANLARRIATGEARKDEDEPDVQLHTVRDLYLHYITGGRHDLSKNTIRTYETYWQRLLDELGEVAIDDVRASDIKRVSRLIKEEVRDAYEERVKEREQCDDLPEAQHRDGRGASENFIAATRSLFKMAVDDFRLYANPAHAERVKKPQRPEPERKALTAERLQQMWDAVRTGGNDPALDALMVRTHLETACRAGGLLSLKVRDLHLESRSLRLYEKGGTVNDQPASLELLEALMAHAEERGSVDGRLPGSTPVFHYKRYKDGRPHPLTRKRYETLFGRLRRELDWAQTDWLRSHHLRHTTITAVERQFGLSVAAAYARHKLSSTTSTYSPSGPAEVRKAHQWLMTHGFGTDPDNET